MRTKTFAGALLIAACAAGSPRPAAGQGGLPSGLTLAAEVGGRTYVGDALSPQQLGKLNEYGTQPKGMLLNELLLRYTLPDSFRYFRLSAHHVGELDQRVAARATQPGLFDFDFRWDRIPHTYSTTARMLGTRPEPYFFSLAGVPRGDTGTVNRQLDYLTRTGIYLGPVRSQWSPMRAALSITPTPAWDLKVEYTRVAKRGDRPMGMSFGSSPGNNSREIMEPVYQQTHDVKLSQGYASDRFQLLVSYDLSLFRNDYNAVVSDNPLATTDALTVGASGRSALAPNNVAHTVVANGALTLPYRTRVNASLSYSAWRQDAAFIPMTINGAVAADPGVSAALAEMPKSLDGRAGTSTVQLGLSSRPLRPLTLTARYRRYEFRDATSLHELPLMIVNDRMPTTITPVEVERDPFTRQNAEFGASWRLFAPVSLTAGFDHDGLDLASVERNTDHYGENTARAGVNLAGNQWVSVRTGYSRSWRRNDGYHQNDTTVLASFRRLDLADRDRARLSVITDVMPVDQVTLTGTWKLGSDEYPGSTYGVQSDRSIMLGGDLDWTPDRTFSMGVGYSREEFVNRMRARYRTPTVDTAAFDWVAKNRDVVAIASAYLNAAIVPDRVDVGATFELSHARYRMGAYNPTTPVGGSASDRANATAVDFPLIRQNYQPVSAFVRYRFTPDWAGTLRFQSQFYTQNDFRTLGNTYALSHMFLGNYYRDFNAQFFTVTLTYNPKAIRAGRSTL